MRLNYGRILGIRHASSDTQYPTLNVRFNRPLLLPPPFIFTHFHLLLPRTPDKLVPCLPLPLVIFFSYFDPPSLPLSLVSFVCCVTIFVITTTLPPPCRCRFFRYYLFIVYLIYLFVIYLTNLFAYLLNFIVSYYCCISFLD